MKKIIYITTVGLITLASCSSPGTDAQKVCDCNKKLMGEVMGDLNDPEKTMKNIGKAFDNECMQMQNEFETKYNESPEKLKVFQEGLFNCQ